jgi:hypothetical protein
VNERFVAAIYFWSVRLAPEPFLTRMRFAISASGLSFVCLSNSKGIFPREDTRAGTVSAALQT